MSALERRTGQLTARQEAFVHAYCETMNATAAAARSGYSRKTARALGSQLLRIGKVRAAVDALLAESLRKAQLSVEAVDAEIAAIAFSNIKHYYDSNGRLLPIGRWPPAAAAAVAAVETIERTEKGRKVFVVRLRLHDKLCALALGAKRLGLLSDRMRIEGGLTLEALIMKSLEPRKEGQP